MYKRGYCIKGLFIVSVMGLLWGYALAAPKSGQNEPNKPASGDQATSTQGSGAAGQTTPPSAAGTAGPMSQSRTGAAGQMGQQAMQLVKSSALIGKRLMNSQNEDLGTIHDLVLTPDHQQVSYAALAHGGTFGIGSKLFAVPWAAFKVGADGKPTASISKQTLDQGTGFDTNNWPSQGDARLVSAGATGPEMSSAMTGGTSPGQSTSATSSRPSSSRATAGGTAPSTSQSAQSAPGSVASSAGTTGEPNKPMTGDRSQGATAQSGTSGRMARSASMDIQDRRVSKLTGLSVRNPQNEDIGDIEDFVINVPKGHLEYTIVSFGGVWGIGEKYAAVPSAAVDLEPQQGMARINADRQTLESVAFDPGSWPDLTSREYSQRLHDVFKEAPAGTALGYVPAGGQQQPTVSSQQAWSAQGDYAKHFDANNVTTIKGTVQSVGTFEPAKGVAEGLRLRVKTSDNKTITVHAGPAWYAQQQKFDLKAGDQVTITGANTKIGWRSVFVASEIQKGSETLHLRSRTGQPLWSTQAQPGQPSGQSSQQSSATPGLSNQSQAGQTSQSGQPRSRTGS